VPGVRYWIVAVVPVPVIPPGLIVQTPLDGSPDNTTLPVGFAHDAGWVIVPTIGARGAAGAAMITTRVDVIDTHPASLITLKSYVPGNRSVIVALVPVPAMAPGFIVHTPDAGNPERTTVPVDDVHDAG
jgi:hypothetical protein